MKKQSILSFLLIFALLLGTIPMVTFAKEYEQLYLWWDEGDYRTNVSHDAGGTDFYLVFTLAEDENTTDDSFTYDCSPELGTVAWSAEKECIIWTPGEAAAQGQITATKEGVTYAIDAQLMDDPEEEEDPFPPEEGDDPFAPIGQISDSHVTTEDDICDDIRWLQANQQSGSASATAAFTLDGETYYLGVGSHGETFPRTGSGMSFTLEEPYIFRYFDIGFYAALSGEGEFARIIDPQLAEDLEAAFEGTLELKVEGLNLSSHTAPAVFPAMHRAQGDAVCCCCTILELGLENWGSYVLTGSGTVNGQDLCVQVTLRWNPRGELVFEPTDDDPIGQINGFFATISPEADVNITINMPAGEYEGYITVPAELTGPEIVIFGALDEHDDPATVIYGGVQTDSALMDVKDISFRGAGFGMEGAPPAEWSDGTPNIALLGDSFIRTDRCRYEGYDIALCGDEVLKFGMNNIFVCNNTAVLLDTDKDAHGMSSLEGSWFIDNGTAIDFEQVPDTVALSDLDLTDARFVDNDVDIWNKLKRNIFLPGCYFAYADENGDEQLRECVYRPVAVGNAKKQVLYYPQAQTDDCDSFLFDTAFYQRMPVVSVHFTKTFPIPANALDGAEFTVMKGDTELARIRYDAQPAQTVSLLGGSSQTFDATVQVDRSTEGQITITLQDIPTGKTPTVSVPCDAGWMTVCITDPQGDPLEGTVRDGYVSFVADQGGTYTIAAEYILTDHNDGSFTLRLPQAQTGKVLLIAGYSEQQQLVAAAVWGGAEETIPSEVDVTLPCHKICIFLADALTYAPVADVLHYPAAP